MTSFFGKYSGSPVFALGLSFCTDFDQESAPNQVSASICCGLRSLVSALAWVLGLNLQHSGDPAFLSQQCAFRKQR